MSITAGADSDGDVEYGEVVERTPAFPVEIATETTRYDDAIIVVAVLCSVGRRVGLEAVMTSRGQAS